jgi:hypothetical protein
MLWYHSNNDGTCSAHQDTREVRALIDAKPRNWYASAEGTIIHGAVRACAFVQHREQVYDAMAWIKSRQLVPMGERVITTITARSEGPSQPRRHPRGFPHA